jgi:hypothetical protein
LRITRRQCSSSKNELELILDAEGDFSWRSSDEELPVVVVVVVLIVVGCRAVAVLFLGSVGDTGEVGEWAVEERWRRERPRLRFRAGLSSMDGIDAAHRRARAMDDPQLFELGAFFSAV